MGLISKFQDAGKHIFGRVAFPIQATTNFIKQTPKAAKQAFKTAIHPKVMASALTFGGAATGLVEETITNTPNQAAASTVTAGFEGTLEVTSDSGSPLADQLDGQGFRLIIDFDTGTSDSFADDPTFGLFEDSFTATFIVPSLSSTFTAQGNTIQFEFGSAGENFILDFGSDDAEATGVFATIDEFENGALQLINNFSSPKNAFNGIDLEEGALAAQQDQFNVGAFTLDAPDFNIRSSFNQSNPIIPRGFSVISSSVTSVPEPGSLAALLAMSAPALLRWRRRSPA